jgi:glyoxylase-like metal-dependent hydrolase (beta-lactamase superfamily II)
MTTVDCIVSGTWRQNGYVVRNEAGEALVIDPGGRPEAFKALIAAAKLTPLAILNTHAHYDHLGAVVDLIEEYAVPFYLHGADGALLRQANLYKALFGETLNIRIPGSFCDLRDVGGRLKIGGFDVEVRSTPGHTKGSTCFLLDDVMFSGDTLLPRGPGRIDLPGGSASDMQKSLAELSTLPGSSMMYPGHGKALPLEHAFAKALNWSRQA